MSSAPLAVIISRSARNIQAYCYTLAQELGLTLVDMGWNYASSPDHPEDAYHLVLSITKPCRALPQFRYTREQVLGYATDTTKAAIRSEIRQVLEACREDR